MSFSILWLQIAAIFIWAIPIDLVIATIGACMGGVGGSECGLRNILWNLIVVQSVQTILIFSRMLILKVTFDSYSKLVHLVKSTIFPSLPIHLLHGGMGILVSNVLFGENATKYGGLVSGITVSVQFLLLSRNILVFDALQHRRFYRIRRALKQAIFRSSSTGLVLASIFSSIFSSRRMFFRYIFETSLVSFLIDTGMILTDIFLTEKKRTSLSYLTHSLADVDAESALLIRNMQEAPVGSILESLLSLRVDGSMNDASYLLLFAKSQDAASFKSENMSSLNWSTANHSYTVLSKWWMDWKKYLDTNMRGKHLSADRLSVLQKQRFDTVLQSVYVADFYSQGYAFRNVLPLSSSNAITNIRALADCAQLSEFSEERRRSIYNNEQMWIDLWSACVCVVDTLSIGLIVATKHAALQPTLPKHAETSPFMLLPGNAQLAPEEYKKLAWRAEEVSKQLRYSSWTSVGWWHNAFMSEWSYFDPVAIQFRLNYQSKTEAARAQNNGSNGDTARSTKTAWEQQWEREQKAKSGKLGRMVKEIFSRTASQCCRSLFMDQQATEYCVNVLGNMIEHSHLEDEHHRVASTIPATLSSLLRCLSAIEEYSASPAFHVSNLPTNLRGHTWVRMEVLSVSATIRRVIYQIVLSCGSQINNINVEKEYQQLLQQFIKYEQ